MEASRLSESLATCLLRTHTVDENQAIFLLPKRQGLLLWSKIKLYKSRDKDTDDKARARKSSDDIRKMLHVARWKVMIMND